ncbi:DUF6318 family protein [Arthrobacter sp. B0490]|uniref:DUF6318 family protein n=1 Tax=Arthrobacter sp. B0490 TaxID=2058891 RepID=UPI0011B01FEE|nr:DUF6318 family protein [Arthrobacter sp. B0490]
MFLVRAIGHGRRSRRRTVLPRLAGAAVALVLLTGCQGDPDPTAEPDPDPQPSSSSSASSPASAAPTASASPEPSPASSAGPASNIPVPVKPALADENSAEGLEAFTEYWFELFSYGYETNDWAPFEAVTDPGCRTCDKYVEIVQGIYNKGQYIEGGEFILEEFVTDFAINTQGSIQVFVTNGQSDITFYGSDGIEIRTDAAPEPVVDVIFAAFTNGSWIVLDYGKPEGT